MPPKAVNALDALRPEPSLSRPWAAPTESVARPHSRWCTQRRIGYPGPRDLLSLGTPGETRRRREPGFRRDPGHLDAVIRAGPAGCCRAWA
jgi:hypothetical protein